MPGLDVTPKDLLLGTAGWRRADWTGGYYPEDLPEDWQLAYYANDCDCVLLDPSDTVAGDAGFRAALDELDDGLAFFVLAGTARSGAAAALVEALRGRPLTLLVDAPLDGFTGVAQWRRHADGSWRAPGSDAGIVRWQIDTFDLRALRRRAEALRPGVRALVLDGPGASPAHCRELRVLLQLLRGG